MCVTVPFSVNIVWVNCLCALQEGARQSNAYGICSQKEVADWPLWLTSISYTVQIPETLWICLQSDCACRAMCSSACCFSCAFCVKHICVAQVFWSYCHSAAFVFNHRGKRICLDGSCKFTVRLQETGQRSRLPGSSRAHLERQRADFTKDMKRAHAELVKHTHSVLQNQAR